MTALSTALAACRRLLCAAVLLGLAMTLASGCKTSEDAAAAATQLTATASSMQQFYTALEAQVTQTDQLYRIQAALNPLAPYDEFTRSNLAGVAAEIQTRKKLAEALVKMAVQFAALSGSTAPDSASAAAGNLETAVEGLTRSTVKLSAVQSGQMKSSVSLIVRALQEHRERQAAREIDQFTAALDGWFRAEIPYYDSIGKSYAATAQSLLLPLVAQGQVDPAATLGVLAQSYGVTLQLTDAALRTKLQALQSAQIEAKTKAMVEVQQNAAEKLAEALGEMASRIHLVATGRPMQWRSAPPTLAELEQWIALVPQIAPARAATKN